MTKYGFDFPKEIIAKDVDRLTSQVWKLIPMRENGEDWVKQLNTAVVHTFEDLYAINISRDLFDLYLCILLFYRPIRNYESAYVFLDFIDNITDSYTIVIYTYLVLNTFFE